MLKIIFCKKMEILFLNSCIYCPTNQWVAIFVNFKTNVIFIKTVSTNGNVKLEFLKLTITMFIKKIRNMIKKYHLQQSYYGWNFKICVVF